MCAASIRVTCCGEFALSTSGIPNNVRGMSVPLIVAAILAAVSGRMTHTRDAPPVVIAASSVAKSTLIAAAVTPLWTTAVAPFVIAAGRNPATA